MEYGIHGLGIRISQRVMKFYGFILYKQVLEKKPLVNMQKNVFGSVLSSWNPEQASLDIFTKTWSVLINDKKPSWEFEWDWGLICGR